jgi:DNA polymerase-3 subunit delta'
VSPRAPASPDAETESILGLGEIIGQDRVIAMLRESIARGALHHALLFVGPEGVGKRSAALALTRRLLCSDVRQDEACGVCSACIQVAARSHPDLRVEGFFYDEKKKESRESVAIDQVRAAQAFVAGQAIAGGRKIVVFEEAHGLTEEAQNALLKTLEEPPRHSLIVLVCHNASRLAVTVRSRCQRVPFSPLGARDLATILAGRARVAADDAALVSAYSDGSLAFAASPERLREAHERVGEALTAIARRSYPDVAAAAKLLLSSPKGLPLDLRLLVLQLRQRMRAAAGLEVPHQLTPPDKTANLVAALRAVEAAYEATVDVGRHANRRLTVERLGLRLAESLE